MHRASRVVSTLALAAALAATSACTGTGERTTARPSAPATSSSAAAPTRTGQQIAAEQHAAAQRIMHRRARAVRRDDEQAYLADLDPSNTAMVRRQKRLFANLTALPLKKFTLDAIQASWPSDFASDEFRATAYIPYVEQKLQLRGFDPMPVTTLYGLTLAPVHGQWKIVSDDDVADREADGARNQPWDLTSIVVHRSAHTLGIFDTGSDPQSRRLMRWTEESLQRVREAVPFDWPGKVVVYALSDDKALRTLGERMLTRAAVAFPVLDNNESPKRLVSTRVTINPEYLPRNEGEGTYLLSHEITHVALAKTNGGTPAWVQEGLADYVATRGGDTSVWYIAPSSVERAKGSKGPVRSLPSSTYFGDDDPAFDYDLSLAACVYLADTYGETRLWDFLQTMADAGFRSGDPEGSQRKVLRAAYGIGPRELARQAARVIVEKG